ncbi:Hypothetical protein AT6N2_L0007 [Agrobacterium tumefaciens]|nr:Hypothetical protein AT6N2_L0007 [Agrobacterium tumefaciens]
MVVEGTKVHKIEVSPGKLFLSPGVEHKLLELIKFGLVCNIRFVTQDVGVGIAQGIIYGIISHRRQAFLKAFTISLRYASPFNPLEAAR